MIHCLMRWRSRIQNARSNEATLSRQEERSETARHEVRGVYDRSPFRCIVHRIADTPAAEAISSSWSCGTQREALDREPERTKSAGETSFESESHFYSFIPSIHVHTQSKETQHAMDRVGSIDSLRLHAQSKRRRNTNKTKLPATASLRRSFAIRRSSFSPSDQTIPQRNSRHMGVSSWNPRVNRGIRVIQTRIE